MIPLARPSLGQEEIGAVEAVLRSGQLVQGQHVASFEARCVRYLEGTHAVAVSSCTAALHMAALALDLGPGDRIAVPAFSWPATANAVVLAGAEPVFIDIEPETWGMDPDQLERMLADGLAGVVLVHAFGRIASVRRIAELCAQYGVPLIEDAACAFGARLDGRSAGLMGTIGCFSFHPRKALTTGEGGLLVTADRDLASRLRVLRNHGIDDESGEFVEPGFNYRMTEMQAALGQVQVDRFDEMLANRVRLAGRYTELLQDSKVVVPNHGRPGEHSFQSYVVLLPDLVAGSRAELIDRLRIAGVQTTIGTIHIPLTKYYRERWGHEIGHFPTTDAIYEQALTLPLYEGLTEDDVSEVVETLLTGIDAILLANGASREL